MTSLLYQQQQIQSAAVQAALTGASSSSQRPAIPSLGIHPNTADLGLDLHEPSEVSDGLLTLTTESGSLKVPEIRSK